jgi:DNA-binding transcriptional regulator YhcF (GntR family)
VSDAPKITIDLGAPDAAYRQIANQVRLLVLEGSLKPGDQLPGVRRLSLDLGVHFNTVAEAYRQLAAEGWVDLSHGKTARIRTRETPSPEPESLDRFRDKLRHLVGEMRGLGFSPERIRRELRAFLDAMEQG